MGIKYSRQAEKFLSSQSDRTYYRIKSAVERLPEGDTVKIKGHTDIYRLRVGSIRIAFRVENGSIFVKIIDNRGQVYDRL